MTSKKENREYLNAGLSVNKNEYNDWIDMNYVIAYSEFDISNKKMFYNLLKFSSLKTNCPSKFLKFQLLYLEDKFGQYSNEELFSLTTDIWKCGFDKIFKSITQKSEELTEIYNRLEEIDFEGENQPSQELIQLAGKLLMD